MSDLFLDTEDVEHLTGRKRPSDQIAWLRNPASNCLLPEDISRA